MADVDTPAARWGPATRERLAGAPDDVPRAGAGSSVFAVSMLLWASGHLVYDRSVAGAWLLFLAGGVGASVGLRLAVGALPRSTGRAWARWPLSWSLTSMLVLVGVSSTLDGAARMIAVSAGVTLLVVGFVQAMAQLREAQQRLAELAVIEERQRVAADVHDIVGHALAVNMLHLNAARLSLPDRPDAAAEALEEAHRNGRASMTELRGVVRLLRSDDGPSMQSLPDLSDLPALVERVTGTGRPIVMVDETDPARLSRLASVTLYGIAREGLTNAVRYGARPIEVALTVEQEDVMIEITNDIRADAERVGVGGGVGLASARTRVHAIGGTFEAGVIGEGRWRLCARIPA